MNIFVVFQWLLNTFVVREINKSRGKHCSFLSPTLQVFYNAIGTQGYILPSFCNKIEEKYTNTIKKKITIGKLQ